MSEEEIFQALKELIVEQLGVDEEKVTMEAAFTDDLGADSLDVVELVMSIEERFNVEISDDQADKILEVKNLVKQYLKNIKLSVIKTGSSIIKAPLARKLSPIRATEGSIA